MFLSRKVYITISNHDSTIVTRIDIAMTKDY